MPQASWSTALAAAALLCTGACSDGGGSEGTADTRVDENGAPLPAGSVDCTSDPRLGEYLGVDTMGELGVLAFRLEQLEPSPPVKGINTFQLQIHDTAGAPMLGELRVDPRMPDHGHGTSIRPRISSADGLFTIEQLYLFMAGIWRIELEARDAGVVVDRKALFFCIEG